MRRVLAAAVLLASAPAGADEADPEADPEADVEITAPAPIHIGARLDADTARFAVRYVVRADRDGWAQRYYGLPARGLVTAATVTEGGRRHALALVDAERASEEFYALWDRPAGKARRWAVLLQAEPYTDNFSILPAVARTAALVVDAQVSAPTCFHRDARYVAVPTDWLGALPATMHVSARESEVVTAACPRTPTHLHENRWVKFPARELARRPGGAERVAARAGRLALGTTGVVKVELNLAARVADVPADLATAIVVDASRSMTPEALEAQRDTIAAYLRAAPHGRVQVIAYAREARALLPSWTAAVQAAPRIERELRALQLRNGSNIAAGLRAAGDWLARTAGTRRIVLFTDEHLTTRDEHTHALDDALPPATLVHVVALGGNDLARDDEAKLARLAARTRGMSVRGGEGKPDATLLARPISLDRVRIHTPGWQTLVAGEHACPTTADDDEPASLAEGTQCTWWGRGDAVAAPFTVEGYLWGERVERVLRADLGRSLELVRELAAMRVLDEALQKLAERAARAVNSVWSLYATWGGDDGYGDNGGLGGVGWGTTCDCHGGFIDGIGGPGFLHGRVDLAPELARIARTCRPDQRVDVEVETTREEIVDVTVQAVSAETRRCVEEALWNAWLVAPGAPARTITRFAVEPA